MARQHFVLGSLLLILGGLVYWICAAPLPFTEVSASPTVPMVIDAPDRASDAIREALLAGHSVELVRHEAVAREPGSRDRVGAPHPTVKYENRRLSPLDRAKALGIVGRLTAIAESPFKLEGLSEIEQEVHIAQRLKDRALMAAVQKVIKEDGCFMTKGVIPELKNDDQWHYWNADVPMREGESRWVELLYVPIDLRRFPEVRGRKSQLSAVKEFQRADANYSWNGLPFEDRSRLVALAADALRELSDFDAQLTAATDPAEKARLAQRKVELLQATARIPREYHPTTLEAIVR